MSRIQEKLNGKVALVTGGGSGIGRATAIQLALEGANVCVADISKEGGEETLGLVSNAVAGESRSQRDAPRSSSPISFFVKADVSKEGEVKNMIESTIQKFGKLDILFNNAGIYEWTSVEETPTETWDRIIAVNLRGSFLGTKCAAPHLKKTRGVIVNTSSSLGLSGAPESAAYCASKSGIIGLTRASALDLARYGVRVNCICPGSIETSMQQREFARSGKPDRMRKAYDKIYPMGRIGKPEEVAKLVVFLASDDSSFMTGTPFLIDGGLFAQWGEALASKIMV
jgi:NAD(P)-dependent dehydrogenase (short-subunit alcohol dehydrogenase family)